MKFQPQPHTSTDIDAQIRRSAAEMRLRAADIIENVSDAFVALDRDWHILYANHEACRINQKPLSEFIGKIHWEEWPASVGTELERQFRRVMDEGVAVHFEHRYVLEPYDVWLEIDVYPADDGLNLFYRDISERKAVEQTLRQFQFLSDNANDAFFLLDAAGRFVYVNAAACRSLGYTPEQFGQMRPLEIDPFYDDAQYQALFQKAEGVRLPPFESSQRRADGSLVPVEASVSRLNIGGRALLLSSCRDITERKKAEQDLLQAGARQRAFLRDVLLSVTEGHLILCDTADDLPAPQTPVGGPIALSQTGGLWELRHQALDAADGMAEERRHDLVTAVSEAGMNAIVHAGGGIAQVSAGTDGKVQVRIEDQGGGISMENLPRATLSRGFSTKATLGHGLKMMLETADRVYMLTGPAGTIVALEQNPVPEPPAWLDGAA